jgi:hypothetical protein
MHYEQHMDPAFMTREELLQALPKSIEHAGQGKGSCLVRSPRFRQRRGTMVGESTDPLLSRLQGTLSGQVKFTSGNMGWWVAVRVVFVPLPDVLL